MDSSRSIPGYFDMDGIGDGWRTRGSIDTTNSMGLGLGRTPRRMVARRRMDMGGRSGRRRMVA